MFVPDLRKVLISVPVRCYFCGFHFFFYIILLFILCRGRFDISLLSQTVSSLTFTYTFFCHRTQTVSTLFYCCFFLSVFHSLFPTYFSLLPSVPLLILLLTSPSTTSTTLSVFSLSLSVILRTMFINHKLLQCPLDPVRSLMGTPILHTRVVHQTTDRKRVEISRYRVTRGDSK